MTKPGKPSTPSKKPPRKRSCLLRLGCLFLILVLLGALAAAGAGWWLYKEYSQDLPDISNVGDYRPKEVSRIYSSEGEVVASLTDSDTIFRTVVSFDEIPQVMRNAILAAEDAEFYSHPGLDYLGLARAIVVNLRRGQLSQGASTITQQVVKNLVLSPERTIRRKVQEALLAFQLEDRLTKDEILTIYLNEVFFGSRYYGVEEASRYYFGHGASELTLAEAALLAGLVQSPNRYNPHFHPEEALARRSYVLRQMWEKGFIEEAIYRETDASPIELDPARGRSPFEGRFGWYVDAVRRELLRRFDADTIYTGGLHIDTALDMRLQQTAEDVVRAGLQDFDARHGLHRPYQSLSSPEAVAEWRRQNHGDIETAGLRSGHQYRAVILEHGEERSTVAIGSRLFELSREPMDRLKPDDREWDELFPPHSVFTVVGLQDLPPGELSAETATGRVGIPPLAQAALATVEVETRRVRALVGGFSFEESPYNRAVQATRQVGSAFKPVVYGAALEARVATPATVFLDQPVTFPMAGGRTWQPRNYDGKFAGPMNLRDALASSRNVIAVRVLDLVGLGPVHNFARELGIQAELTDNLTLALGSAEITPLEVTNAFATFPAGGVRATPVLVERVTTRSGQVLFQADPGFEQTVSPDVAWLTTSLMSSVVQSGTGTAARAVGVPVAGKTGTTNGARDAWFLGFSRQYATGVWVGHDNNQELGRGETGGRSALPIWVNMMKAAQEGLESLDFEMPETGIRALSIDPPSGLLAYPGGPTRREFFLEGTEPRETALAPSERSVQDVLLNGGSAYDPEAPVFAGDPGDDGF